MSTTACRLLKHFCRSNASKTQNVTSASPFSCYPEITDPQSCFLPPHLNPLVRYNHRQFHFKIRWSMSVTTLLQRMVAFFSNILSVNACHWSISGLSNLFSVSPASRSLFGCIARPHTTIRACICSQKSPPSLSARDVNSSSKCK